MELFDASGKKYEAFTQEEVAQRIQTATSEVENKIKAEFTEKEIAANNALAKANDDLKRANEALLSGGDKGENYKQLREAKELAEKNLAEANKKTEEAISAAIRGITATFATKYKDELVNKLAQGNEALSAKLKVHYEKTLSTMPANTDAEIAARVEAAYRLSVDNVKPGLLSQVIGARPSSTGGNGASGPNDPPTEVLKWGSEFGLTKDEIIKYTEKAKKTYVNVVDKS